jgi:RNA polymerase sigma-70 factor (ECF subfamily)
MPAELSDRLQASDAALAARVALGDAVALTPLYQRHRAPIYRFALLWSASAAVAADVTQDVFVHLLTKAADYDPARGPLQPWLLGVTRNFVHRRTGADARYVANDDDAEPPGPALESPTPETALATQRDIARLRAAIAALPPHYRDVLVLVELTERSYARPRHLRLRTQHRALAAVPGARAPRPLARCRAATCPHRQRMTMDALPILTVSSLR